MGITVFFWTIMGLSADSVRPSSARQSLSRSGSMMIPTLADHQEARYPPPTLWKTTCRPDLRDGSLPGSKGVFAGEKSNTFAP